MKEMTENKAFPKLRFKDFEGSWETKKFENLFERVTTKNKENNQNVLTISAQKGLINQKEYFNRHVSAKDVRGYYLLREGDFAYNKSYSKGYPFGAIKKLNNYEKGVVSTLYICFKVKENISEFYMEQFFNSGKINKEIYKIAQEGARNHGLLNMSVREFFQDIKITLPSLAEQQKIASFLIKVDAKLQQLNKKKELLEDYKKGLMQKIFSQKLRFKDNNGNDYPDWEEKKIGEVFEERNEKNHINMELLSVSLNRGIFRQSESNKKDNSNSDKSKYKRVLIGDIAYNSMRMWQGASAVSKLNGIISPAYTVLKSNKFNCSEYFGYLFKMSFMIQIFQKHSQGLTSDTWNLKYRMISKIKINVPSLKEQKKIANSLSSLDEKIELLGTQIENSKAFKKWLLQQMFV